MRSKKKNKILDALIKVEDHFRITIQGCGCCGSPWITDLDAPQDQIPNLNLEIGTRRTETNNPAVAGNPPT